jgi:hypothetical protein
LQFNERRLKEEEDRYDMYVKQGSSLATSQASIVNSWRTNVLNAQRQVSAILTEAAAVGCTVR